MIGGIDIRLPTKAGRASIEIAIRAIRQRWPQAAFENPADGERYADFSAVPDLDEVLVYRDEGCADAWDEEGAVPGTHNTMIHLLHEPGMLFVVIDESSAAMYEMIAAMTSALRDEIHFLEASAA